MNVLQKAAPYFLCLLLTLICFGVHMSPAVNSMLNGTDSVINQEYLQKNYEFHKDVYVFAKRPLTNTSVQAVANAFNTTVGEAFILVNFFFFFLSGIILVELSKLLHAKWNQILINLVFFYTNFSILFAFFVPIYTYDEPIQYFLIFLSFLFFLKERWFWFSLTFCLATIARESSLFLLPGLFILYYFAKGETTSSHQLLPAILYLALPVLAYVAYSIITPSLLTCPNT